MCGILGGNNPNWNYKAGIECMKHRGPDGIRISPLSDFTLAFARLAIIDLSEHGMQPMFSLDKQVGIVFNGEIYGYQNLRNSLMKRGYKFKSTSDTEVILNAYLEWGEKFISKVDGMFGLAIYDKREETVRLYRDRAGIKPLYYYYDGVYFGFSSELKGIVNMCNNIELQIDNTAVYDYLNYTYVPAPKTLYKNVYKVLPGHRITFNIMKKKIVNDNAYWNLKVNEYQGKQRKQNELIDELRYLIRESVKEQLIADVPVGTFLSGGVDSSIITYESNLLHKDINSFSIGFTEEAYDELKYVRMLISKYNFVNECREYKYNLFLEDYHKLYDWYDEPFADISAFPTHFVSAFAREKVKVVLTGDGADEVFGGYRRYLKMKEKEDAKGFDNLLVTWLYFQIKHDSKKEYKWLDDLSYYLKIIAGANSDSDKELRKKYGIDRDYDKFWALRRCYIKDLPPITRTQFLELKTRLPDGILTKVDRASMDVSLETRVPFLNRKIMEFAFSLSEEDRCPKGQVKGLLKKAYEDELGRVLMYRPKKGFCVPDRFLISSGKTCSKQQKILNEIWDE